MKLAHEGHHAQKLASARGIGWVFALSNRAANFFITSKLGYAPAMVEDLPATRRAKFEASGRDSLVFSLKHAAD